MPNADDLFVEAKSAEQSQRELTELVSSGLASLNAAQREVVELKTYGGLTFREIGEVIGAPLQTVATRYRAALEHLRAWITKQTS